ncbi:hypothetical protein HRR83_003474 [Exophiala dermatitidis]|uniref:Uncharacterized protein n=2 Tax=Exophiala dermatitidis TaxID=5970 RepID=H6BLX5_EXODN|nr:uncharacterized protein HMPREF1120_00187 [Exophiala dermatitidis NIH/UT8656]KAJ4518069.1 hypothetical protein HRR74_004364 [Exophiala dermatitidis]EHY51964.1 hypothetical protein HMPREF1120_00187 [Exophiala dermatitidis NIH/UT8656]KAJ4520968.1 hypothetical protein HRR73_003309 [Exophiala dermatitidis]KAJ4547545.1 hypothetical protein HRR76_000182 [Exophiala dermatitidis]KAJ4553485.1 hypothetical protein HRR77_001874 [Exophiala dermatitidis]
MSVPLTLFHAVQGAASAYAGLLSAIAIYNLQQREDQAEHAAQYSNTAGHLLHKTRMTQTSGALAAISSMISSIVLAVTSSSEGQGGSLFPILLSTANAVGLGLAYRHIRNFWLHRAKVPFLSDYNDGVTASKNLQQALGAQSITWAASSLVHLWFFMGA